MANVQARLGLRITNPSPPSPKLQPKKIKYATYTSTKHVRFILPVDIPPCRAINLHILRSQCSLATEDPWDALQQSDIALQVISEYNAIEFEPTAQLCRAKSLMKLERWEEARLALVRAASIRDRKAEVEGLGKRCQHMLSVEEYNVDIERYWRAVLEEEARKKRG